MSLDIDLYAMRRTSIFEANITHNLGAMADAAGIYDCLWRAPENGFTLASQLIDPLTNGIAKMKADPAHFQQFNAKNGWGLYENFLPWLEKLLAACIENPDAEISISR
jgi:hypothetical protein